jgi:ADP-dependent NAD(P)H-hydrate dehydratase / NAD(P)H-hydrate epimerase
MSWVVVGTVPYEGFPFVDFPCTLDDGNLCLGEHSVPITRGTPALLAAACMAARVLGVEAPQTLLAGDIGLGDGSIRIYKYLVETLKSRSHTDLMVFHYLLPEVDWHNRILIELDDLSDRPLLVADAGYMYVAKMSGFATSYDLFTPDVGEMAFLADESAPHPFYTRGFLLQEEERVPELIERAYKYENASRYLLVKGRRDIVASAEGTVAEISEPCVENMEPIGGTGDTLTGIVAALLASGRPIPEAAALAARINRLLGELTKPTPAFSVSDLLPSLPVAMETVLSESS